MLSSRVYSESKTRHLKHYEDGMVNIEIIRRDVIKHIKDLDTCTEKMCKNNRKAAEMFKY